ncbi:MAG TPA: transposase [Candidatus Paceibacterota bacterium]|nr:transposase [Candidatus Paceibacterota bacterium]
MARRVTLAVGELYHLYNRGTDKRDLFKSTRDYDRFSGLLFLCNQQGSIQDKFRGLTSDVFLEPHTSELIVDIAAYCLMPNHFHLVARERSDGGISKFMQKVTTGYTMYFNKRYDRSGGLFQGTFKVRHVDNDTYFKYLIAYVHLNPIKLIDPQWKENGIVDYKAAQTYLEQYRYSSYQDYLGKIRSANAILAKDTFNELFDSLKDFEMHALEWLNNGLEKSEV